MKIPLTLSAPHTLRLKSDAAGEFLMAGHDEGFVGGAREVHPSHHAAAGDAGFAAFVAHLPSVELFVGPLPASAMPFFHAKPVVTHAFAPMPVAHASGFAGAPLAAAALAPAGAGGCA